MVQQNYFSDPAKIVDLSTKPIFSVRWKKKSLFMFRVTE